MSRARFREAINLLPAGHPATHWLRERWAYFESASDFGISLEQVLELGPHGRARRDHLLRQLHREHFPGLLAGDAERSIGKEIRRYQRVQFERDRKRGHGDGSPLGELLFELLSLDLPLGTRTVLRALDNF